MSRIVPPAMTAAWKSPAKIGKRRPVVRATIQHQRMNRFPYDTAFAQGGDLEKSRYRTGTFKSFVFGGLGQTREVRNIISCSWDRSTDQDSATCTLILLNTDLTAIGEGRDNPSSPDEFDKPGYFTYNRGDQTIGQNRWGYDDDTGWQGVFMPDMCVRTYEGYGMDPNVGAAVDPNLLQSGTWLIDKVTYGTDGTITLEMRDLARLLLDQIVFPPGIPLAEYPMTWSKIRSELVPARDAKGGSFMDRLKRRGKARSSNDKYVGKGLTNAPFASYVNAGGGVEGHYANHAIMRHDRETPAQRERDLELLWRSTGQDSAHSFVWWEFDVEGDRMPLAAVKMRMAGGPYRVYISVHDGTKWLGKRKIGYKTNGVAGSPGNVDIDADIPFVKSVIADRFHEFETVLPRRYMARRVRLTFTRLVSGGVGEHPYRAGLREFQMYTAKELKSLRFERGEVQQVVGNYSDYTHIVKWVCAWAGWYWPPHSTGQDFVRVAPLAGNPQYKNFVSFAAADPVLPSGRVWGDFMKAGTAGVADLTIEQFDKKPLMDVINYVRDLLGFLFFVDETGGVVWRMPNVWSLGNYVTPQNFGDGRPGKRGRGGRTSEIVTIDEEETMLDYTMTLDSTNLRERIFVANAVGGLGTVVKGFNPNPVGLARVAGWSDQHFETKEETRVMASLISARSMFTYRQGSVTIPGYPKIQVDDQVRLFERVTNETYYHYVLGIKSELDMDAGTWTYDLTTHWLGERPSDAWAVKSAELPQVARQYLAAIGYTANGAEDKDD